VKAQAKKPVECGQFSFTFDTIGQIPDQVRDFLYFQLTLLTVYGFLASLSQVQAFGLPRSQARFRSANPFSRSASTPSPL
jgi:hypothetical protein